MDWNHDGKIDHQDHAFYNNVVSDDAHKSSVSGGKNNTPKQTTYINGKMSEKDEKTCQIIVWVIVGIILFFKLVIGD